MWQANPTWGPPRIVGELRKLGIDIAKSTVEKYRPKLCRPTRPWWSTFLKQHIQDIVAINFFTVPTAQLRVLFVLIVLTHDRRRVVYFNVTEHPTSEWTTQQLVEAFPWEPAPKYLLRDHDAIYGNQFRKRVRSLGMKERPIAPRSPWQNPYAERVIGSIRRECLDHVVVLNEGHLKRLLHSYLAYYHEWRPHRSLEMDSPEGRPIHSPEQGEIIEFPAVHGLHHYYLRQAAWIFGTHTRRWEILCAWTKCETTARLSAGLTTFGTRHPSSLRCPGAPPPEAASAWRSPPPAPSSAAPPIPRDRRTSPSSGKSSAPRSRAAA
jgi:hypothetical protein